MGVKDALLGRLLGNASAYSQGQIAETISLLLAYGLRRGATDIHLEPHGQVVWVRYRIHGSLHGLHKLPLSALEPIVTELKHLAGLPLHAHMPHEAEFSLEVEGEPREIRLSTMPVIGGERAVLHFCQPSAAPSDLRGLGFWGDTLERIHSTLGRTHGLILVNGPKQSPRPATLYALLQLLRTAPISIAAIEEHPERRLAGVTQTRLGQQAGSYHEALRAALSQDMNAVMLANLPSKQDAKSAVAAAATGHLILGGQHTDTGAAGIIHLLRMDVEPYMLAAALRLSIAVRSVRRLCPECRQRIALSPAQTTRLEKLFDMTTAANKKRVHSLEKQAEAAGIGAGLPISTAPGRLTHAWRAEPNGCEHCHHTGYQGSVTLTEVVPGGDFLYKALTEAPSLTTLQAAALQHGLIPLTLDGIIKSLRGETTIAEVMYEVGNI